MQSRRRREQGGRSRLLCENIESIDLGVERPGRWIGTRRKNLEGIDANAPDAGRLMLSVWVPRKVGDRRSVTQNIAFLKD